MTGKLFSCGVELIKCLNNVVQESYRLFSRGNTHTHIGWQCTRGFQSSIYLRHRGERERMFEERQTLNV